MLQTEYIRSLNCNYERILLENKPEEKRYQYCILNRGGIKNLLPCSLRYINGLVYLYYDISSRQNIMQLYGGRSISRKWVLDFVWGIRQVEQELERFLLDVLFISNSSCMDFLFCIFPILRNRKALRVFWNF